MIYELQEKWAVYPILDMLLEKKDLFRIRKDKLEDYLSRAVEDDDAIIIINEKDRDIGSFLYASIEEIDGEEAVFINACISEPKKADSVFELLSRLMKWAASKNLDKIFFLSNVHMEGFKRKYGFEKYSELLFLNIDDVARQRAENKKYYKTRKEATGV